MHNSHSNPDCLCGTFILEIMSVKINNYIDERSKASKFVRILIKICLIPISIEEDVIKFKISKTIIHILLYPGLCFAQLLFVRFYFNNTIYSTLVVANGFFEFLAILLYKFTSGKTFISQSKNKTA